MFARLLTTIARPRWRWPLVLAPLVLVSGLVALYHGTAPMYDEWALAPLFQKHYAGQLGLSDFWHQYTDHRIFLPQLILFGLGRVTGWDLRYEVVIGLGIAAATFALLAHIIRSYFATPEGRALATIVASGIVFSPIAWENWLWGWQVSLFLNVFGLMLALAALTAMPRRTRPQRFALAVIGALIASLSMSQGLLIWFVVLPVFLLDRQWRRWTGPWLALAGLVIVAYARNYHDLGSTSGFLDDLPRFARYVQTYMARPITYQTSLIGVSSAVLLIAAVGAVTYTVRQRTTAFMANLPWLILMLYVLATALMTAAGRVQLGLGQASTSRYTTTTGLFLLSVVMILLQVYAQSPHSWVGVASGAMVALLLLLVAVNYADGVRQMERHYSEIETVASKCARTATGPDDICLYSMHFGPRALWPLLQFARAHHLAGL